MASVDGHETPLFSAVSSSARQLFLLLRCIGFAQKAQVQITKEGLRFTVEESRVMQGQSFPILAVIGSSSPDQDPGLAFLDKALFTTFNYTPTPSDPSSPSSSSSDPLPPTFQISLSSLLETLQIFGVSETKDRWSTSSAPYPTISTSTTPAFSTRTLGMSGLCRLSYAAPGSPLCIHLEESGLATTCELSTYEPDLYDDIPLQRNALALKIIMRASCLHDAIAELASTSPTRLTLTASPTRPYFTLSATGPLGSATVEFSRDQQLLETFQVERRSCQTYRFSLVRAAQKAMAAASKVSVRGDGVGVLSLQFMVEVEGGGVSFVDFRFVPFVVEEGEGEGVGEDEGGGEDG